MTHKIDEEIWDSIDGFPNYEVSNHGKIRSKPRKVWHKGSETFMRLKGKLMSQRWNKICKCYFLDLIDHTGKRRTVYPHKVTAQAFVRRRDDSKTMIIHLDNNPKNNHHQNLQWVTKSEHMKWQFEVGNKDNHKVWKTRKKKYKNGFKPETILPGRPRKNA